MMKFNIKNPVDNKLIVLDMVPEEHEEKQVLKITFPEKNSITMIRKNGIWSSATKTDLSNQLVKAISKGIHAHIKQNKIYRNHISFKLKSLETPFSNDGAVKNKSNHPNILDHEKHQ